MLLMLFGAKVELSSRLVSIRNNKEEKVLGTIFDSKIDFSRHLTNITSKRQI